MNTHKKNSVFLMRKLRTQNFSSHFYLVQHVIHFYINFGIAASNYPALQFWIQMRMEYRCTQDMRISQRYWRRRPSSGLRRSV